MMEFPVELTRSGYLSEGDAAVYVLLPEGWEFVKATEHRPASVGGFSFGEDPRHLVRLVAKKKVIK